MGLPMPKQKFFYKEAPPSAVGMRQPIYTMLQI